MAKTQAIFSEKDAPILNGNAFRETSNFTTGASSSQGAAFDGTNYFVSDNSNLYKYSSAGSLVTSHDTSSDGTYGDHLGGLCAPEGDYIYAVGDNYNTTPKAGMIMKYNKSDLTFVEEFAVTPLQWTSDIAFHDGKFWVINNNETKIFEYDDEFTLVKTHTLDYALSGTHWWNGITWRGNSVYLNPHEQTHPQDVVQFFYNGESFQYVGNLTRPYECSQGFDWDDANNRMVFAKRAYSGSDAVVITQMESEASHTKRVGYSHDLTTPTTTSTSYVENTTITTSIYARKGDLIKIELVGIFKVSASSCRVYPNEASANTTTVTEVNNGPTIRTQVTNGEGITLGTFKIYRADEDGIVVFTIYWRLMAAGTLTLTNGTMLAQIVGREM